MVAQNQHSDVKSTSQYKAVHDYLNGHVTSPAKAQDKFCEPVEDKFMSTQNSEDIEGLLWATWASVVELAKSNADNADKRQKLVDFVLDVQHRPRLQKGENVCRVWDATVWSDLPVFGAEIRECWNAVPTDNSSAEEQRRWLNVNAFVAALVASAHQHGDKPDFTLYAVWALRQALEEDKPNKLAIQVAASWIVCTSRALFELSKSQKSFDGKLARAGSSFQDKQWTGFNSERWQTWVSKLNVVHAADLGSHGADLVNKAKQKVGEVEH